MSHIIVIAQTQSHRIGLTPSQLDFFGLHPARDGWQTHTLTAHARRIRRVGHLHLGIARYGTGGLSKGLLKFIGLIVCAHVFGIERERRKGQAQRSG